MEKPAFLSDPNFLYFDCAASTPPFLSVVDAVQDFLSTYGSIHRGFGVKSHRSTLLYEKARQDILDIVGGGQDCELIFCSNTTHAINLMAYALPPTLVATSSFEHSSNHLPWKHAHHTVDIDWGSDYRLTPEKVDDFLSRAKLKPAWLCATGASNITGYRIDIPAIHEVCRAHGVRLFIDASQLAAHARLDMRYCDAVAFSGHKIYAPYGGGVLIVRKGILDARLSVREYTGGGNIIYFDDRDVFYKHGGLSREVGTPNGVGAISIAAALKTLTQVGWERIHMLDVEKTKRLFLGLKDLDFIEILFPEERVLFETPEIITPVLVFRVVDEKLRIPFRTYIEENDIGMREGTFCAYALLEHRLGIRRDPMLPLEKHLEKISVFRLSPGLVTDFEQVDALIDIFKRWGKKWN